jgi:hypothetical protein
MRTRSRPGSDTTKEPGGKSLEQKLVQKVKEKIRILILVSSTSDILLSPDSIWKPGREKRIGN